ncbi:hypothetical protein M438DRAFT_409273 [Aureobasidium pullulans EXF-150]|uniref:Uncharacterized protein n=1 Tax=Aureobasidium pullulans EXF-150 TaxID=1043002 RepID=A0A074XYI4_AURPU|nr:uncharacterized protein M438DRAFT_409273 [Aureobasidium pullulans EXF-150]KEQ79751.1 hypothetical protein M438DRAFT_409273 [Aureobasidium pullulans EXF-150]
MRRNFVRFNRLGPDRQRSRALRSPDPFYQPPEEHHSPENYQPPEEYQRILDQFRSRRDEAQVSDQADQEINQGAQETHEDHSLPDGPGLDDHDALMSAIRTIDAEISVHEIQAVEEAHRRVRELTSIISTPDAEDHDMESPPISTDSDSDVSEIHLDSDADDQQLRNLQREAILLRLQSASLQHRILLEEFKMLTQHNYHKTSVMYAYRRIWVLCQMVCVLDDGIQAWEALMELRRNEMDRQVLRDELTRAEANASYARLANHRDELYDHCVEAGRHYVRAMWSREFGPGVRVEELSESMRELEHHYLIIKRNNVRLQAAMQQMQATFPQDHQVNDARVQALHKNSIHVVRYTMRDASNAMEMMQTGMHTRGNAVKRVVARLVERLSGQGPAWSRSG